MPHVNQDLTALLGSRICHDLISPLGAISNGMELLGMAGQTDTPEFELIADCIASANSKIRYFRVAYGSTGRGAKLGRSEIASILDDNFQGTRLSVIWHPQADLAREDVKRAFLAIQCLETAVPYGGVIEVTRDGEQWFLVATAQKLRMGTDAWAVLSGDDNEHRLEASMVQFGVLRESPHSLLQPSHHSRP